VIHGELVLPEGIVTEGELVFEGAHISEVNLTARRRADVRWDEGWIFPGLVDAHIHGIAGADVMDGSVDSCTHIDRALAALGCTRWVATTMSAGAFELSEVLTAISSFAAGRESGLAGVHLEGPFISPARRGAQPAESIRMPSLFELERCHLTLGPLLRRITLAPELPDAGDLIAFCRRYGIHVSLGHSDANTEEAQRAFDAGAEQVTHLYNGMSGLDHRRPGLALAALTHPGVVVEIIADGVHVHPAMIQLARRLKGPRGVMLVTDAMRAAQMRDGTYDLGGQPIDVVKGIARTSEGNLAGSTLTLMEAVFKYQRFTGVELFEAVRAASLVPARALTLPEVGVLEPGYRADAALVDRHGRVHRTWRDGQVVFLKQD
jgi:N-acetylglucosamine-6-phosphate deacetylase